MTATAKSNVLDFINAARAVQPASPQEVERRLDTLRGELKRRARDLVRELFPAARIDGHDARIGDAKGAPGESMSIELDGERAGQFYDHNPNATVGEGDLITLWCMGQGLDPRGPGFMRAVEDLEIHVGLSQTPRSFGPVARIAAERARAPKAVEPVKINETIHVYTSSDGASVLAQWNPDQGHFLESAAKPSKVAASH